MGNAQVTEAKVRQAKHPRHLGRRHRHREPELLHARAHGLSDAQHRPHRQGRHDVHRFLRRAVLHRGPLVLHHRAERLSHRALQGRHSRRANRHEREDHHHRRARSRTRATPPASSARTISATSTRCCRPITASTSSYGNLYHLNAEEEPELYDYPDGEGVPELQEDIRAARRHAFLRDGHGRSDRAAALGQGRQAEDRGHRPADQEAHGDLRRRFRRARPRNS